jgi:aspartate carbamoyltransferase catalytic subunit
MFFGRPRAPRRRNLAGKRPSADVNVKGSGPREKGDPQGHGHPELVPADVLVIRHASVGACELAARYTDAAVINAGDGKHDTTQTLLDPLRSSARSGLDAPRVRRRRRALAGRPLRHPRLPDDGRAGDLTGSGRCARRGAQGESTDIRDLADVVHVLRM